MFPSEPLLEAEEVVEVESLEVLLERELVLVTLEQAAMSQTPFPSVPASRKWVWHFSVADEP